MTAPNNDDTEAVVNTTTSPSSPPAPPAVVSPSGEMAPPQPKMPPPPPMPYHPDYMFCGECTTCAGTVPNQDEVPVAVFNENEEENLIRTKLLLDHSFSCPSQVYMIQSVLGALPGVEKVLASLETLTVIVDHDAQTSAEHMQDTLKEIRLQAKTTVLQKEETSLCRSQLHVKGICCATECPAVQKILRKLPGVNKIQINITTKMVYVHHDSNLIEAKQCADALNKEGFGAKVFRDGGAQNEAAALNPDVGRSTFHVQKALSEKDVTELQMLLTELPGVQRIGVNVAECVLYVEHNVTEISASKLQETLGDAYPTELAMDASQDITERQTSALQVARSKYVESTLRVTNLTLKHVDLISRTLHQNYVRAQVRAFYPHVPSKTLKVEHNPQLVTMSSMVSLLGRYGLDCNVIIDGSEENLALPLMEDYYGTNVQDSIYGTNTLDDEHANAIRSIKWNVVLSGIFWFISVLSVVGGNWEDLKYAGIVSVIFGLPPIAIKAWRTLRRCQFDANCMMVSAAFGALCLGEFDEAASVAFLFAISEFLEMRATHKARKALGAIVSLKPDHANVIHPVTRELVVVPADKVPIGSLISVRTGDKICADGVVVEGTSQVDESSLTGEALPIPKRPNDLVSGGAINIGSTQLVIRTTCSVDDSAVSRLIRLVEEAQANRSPTEMLIDSFAKTYTPIVVLLAAFMCTIPWIVSREAGRYWTLNGLIIIVIACPCALTISTPVTYSAGLAAAAQRGVIVKGGSRLEALGSVDKVVFDKTGTLTKGKFQVTHLENFGTTRTRKEVLELLALMEAPSSHPLSTTLVKAAKKEGVSIPRDAVVTDHSILKGEGVTALVNGKHVYVGNQRLFRRVDMLDFLPLAIKVAVEQWNQNGGTIGFIGIQGEGIVGAFCVMDAVREEAKQVVRSLQDGKIQVIMLTGDGDGAAKAVAKQIGIAESDVHAQLLPEDKLHFVGSIKGTNASATKCCSFCRTKSSVLMVGDGVNDAPALAVADVGVALGEGAALAMEMSDVTLMDSNLSKLLYVIKMGARVIVTIQENIFISIVAKLLVVALTFVGKMTLLAAIAADVGIMLVVTLNGMKLLPSKRKEAKSLLRGEKRPLTKSESGADVHAGEIEII